VYLIPKHLANLSNHNLTYWRDKQVVSLSAPEVHSIEVKSNTIHWQAQRKHAWEVTLFDKAKKAQEFGEGDKEGIEGFINGLGMLQASEVEHEDFLSPSGQGLLKKHEKLGVLELGLGSNPDGSSRGFRTYTFYKTPASRDKLLVTASNLKPIYVIELYHQDKLKKPFEEVRQARVLHQGTGRSFQFMEIATHGPTTAQIALKHEEEVWRSQDPAFQVASGKVQSMLDKLSTSVIRHYRKPVPKENPKEFITLKLGETDAKVPVQLRFGRFGKKIFVERLPVEGETVTPYHAELDASVGSDLPWDLKEWERPNPEPSP
jgi:hypothetical protein